MLCISFSSALAFSDACVLLVSCMSLEMHLKNTFCSSGSRRGRPKRDENQDEKTKEDDNGQETSNDAENDKSDGKPEVMRQCFAVFLSRICLCLQLLCQWCLH